MNKLEKIKLAQLQQLFSACNISLITSTLLALILAYLQLEVISASVIFEWLALVVLVAFFRAALVYAYQRSSIDEEDEVAVHTWLMRFRLGVLAVGVVWGSSGFLMFSVHDPQHQMFLIFMLAGLSAGGVVSFSADLVSGIIFSLASTLPLAIRLFLTGNNSSVAMGIAVILYLAFMIFSLRHINLTITENIALHIEAYTREEAVKTSEERYRLLLKHSPVGIFHFDKNLIITYCNERLANILQNSIDSIVGSDMNLLKDQSILPVLRNALKGEIVQYGGKYSATHSDADIWVDVICAPSRDIKEKIMGGIAIVWDNTESKQTEEMLRISAIAFETQSAMIVTTPNFVILRANRAFSQLTGYSVQEVIGKTPRMLISGRHDNAFFKGMRNALKVTGHWQGEIWNRRKNGMIEAEWLTISAVTSPEGDITHFVGIFYDITENKDAVAEIHRLAYYDALTHLPNRRLLQDRLNQGLASAIRNGKHGAILFLDLDNFKVLNDTRGHDAGDQLLIEVARRLRTEVCDSDIVGRLGGDEFVVLLENLSKDAEEAAMLTKEVGEKLLASLACPYYLDGYEFHCSTSIGIRLYLGHETVDELLRHADLAMYQAKTAGRNTLCFFDPTMQTMVNARADMEKDLRYALEQNQFKLYYQSQVSRNHQVVGAEVLLCWQHPDRGLVLPTEFIALAEKTSLILPIGKWVLETACAQLKAWKDQSRTKRLQLAVNVSARQFRHPDFVALVKQTLKSNAIEPDLLKLELTESLVLDNIIDTIEKMNALREIGVRFSLDDFGTGYSSFSYLTQLPLDQLKIDRSFVSNIGIKPSDAIIVQTIIGMARNLGIDVIAEGVETEAQRVFLEQNGCPTFQGYLYSRPVQVDVFEQLVGLHSNSSLKSMP